MATIRPQPVVLKLFACAFFWGCGDTNSSYNVSASGGYDSLGETIVPFSRCTPVSNSYGCANVVTSGNIVRSDFVFSNLFVTCATSQQGYTVSLTNSILEAATFKVVVSLFGVSTPPLVALCKGPIKNALGNVTAGSCDVSAQVHAATFASTPDNECLVKFTSTSSPVSGTIMCGFLQSGVNYLTIAGESSFTCQ